MGRSERQKRTPRSLAGATAILALAGAIVATAGASTEGRAPDAAPPVDAIHGDAAATIEHDYVGVDKCKSCHKKDLMGNQYAAWQNGPHRGAFEVLSTARALEIAAQHELEDPPHESDACLSCHVTGHGVPPMRMMNELDPADGVQCESCHGPGRDFRKKKIMSDRERAIAKGLWDATSVDICQRCHNTASPTYEPTRYTLADGTTTDFDFAQAAAAIPHPIPEHVKGRYLELEEAEKKAEESGR